MHIADYVRSDDCAIEDLDDGCPELYSSLWTPTWSLGRRYTFRSSGRLPVTTIRRGRAAVRQVTSFMTATGAVGDLLGELGRMYQDSQYLVQPSESLALVG